ncbi:MAG: VanW family protein [Acidobacteria bacterium]|nr:VanW family protein [Acidobacteriota bacterium]
MRLSEIHPIVYHTRIAQKRLFRKISDLAPGKNFAREMQDDDLAVMCSKHSSLLRRTLGNSDPELQENKVVNLGIAAPTIDGILIKPGQLFSLWRQVGRTTAEKGYLDGMQLSRGEVARGVGGGLCQLSNLLHWMVLHTPMAVAERHHHSFDPFPDDNRVLPFGSGCGVFYNYIDLRFYNPTDITFQLRVKVGDTHLRGNIFADKAPENTYHIVEKGHRFFRKDGKTWRENEIWREVIDRRTGNIIREECLMQNLAEVKYELNFEAAECNV